jgi:hypothetical protein
LMPSHLANSRTLNTDAQLCYLQDDPPLYCRKQ